MTTRLAHTSTPSPSGESSGFSCWLMHFVPPQGGHDAPKLQDIDLPDVDEAVDVSDEDVEFVKDYGKQIGFLTSLDKAALDR